MKNLLIAAMMLGSTVTANAGSVAFTPPQAVAIEEPAHMGGSGAWIIPLVIVTIMVLTLSSNCNSKKIGQETTQVCYD